MSSCSSLATLPATWRSSHRSIASRICFSVSRSRFKLAAPLHDEHGALELADDVAALVLADGADGDDALVRPRFGRALAEHGRLGVERVAREHRLRQLDVLPAEVGDRLLTDIRDAHPHEDRHGERADDERLAEFRALRVLGV